MDEIQIIGLFYLVDDFVKRFELLCSQKQIAYRKKKIRTKSCRTSLSEVMTILIFFHRSNYLTFKHFYLKEMKIKWAHLFPNLVKYPRFVQLISEAFFPMFCFAKEYQGKWTDLQFVDSTVLTCCHVKGASSHRTFHNSARWGKTTTGYFFGFKLHLLINQHAEIVAFRLTAEMLMIENLFQQWFKELKASYLSIEVIVCCSKQHLRWREVLRNRLSGAGCKLL